MLYHGLGDAFFLKEAEKSPRKPRAIFTSQPSRGLDFVASCWRQIAGSVPSAELHVFCPQSWQAEAARRCAGGSNIVIRGSVSRDELAAELRSARAMLIPGVKDETFCLAAAEATASGVPIVTLGEGALGERVKHGETGYIAATSEQFSQFAALLLRDDALWMKQHRACLADDSLTGWGKRAEQWERLFARLLAGH